MLGDIYIGVVLSSPSFWVQTTIFVFDNFLHPSDKTKVKATHTKVFLGEKTAQSHHNMRV
jgi:hypothetical protein